MKVYKNCRICKRKLCEQNTYKSYIKKSDFICMDCVKIKNKDYNIRNRVKVSKNKRKYYYKNRHKIFEYTKKCFRKNLKEWEGFIPAKTTCQICNQTIYFNRQNRKKAICFDHRKKTIINQRNGPTFWLGKHKRTPNTERIWEESDFGMLCNRCNSFLLTKKRKEFLKKVVKYVFDGEMLVQ